MARYKHIIEVVLHWLLGVLHVLLNGCLVESLVGRWILGIDEDLIILENNTLRRVFVEHYVEGNLLIVCCFEESVFLHLLPRQSLIWVVLHCLVKKVKALQGDFYVRWPGPVASRNLLVQQLESHLISCFLFDVEYEHSG